ncbi:MAG: N-acetyltransferase family protein [Rhodospirillaceae bacterium]
MTQPSLCIRVLTETDAPAFRDLRLAGIAEHPEYFGAPYAEEEAAGLPLFEKRIRGSLPGDAMFGVFRGERMVGIAGMFRAASGTMRHRGTLWGVYVDPAERGGDTAERLIRAVIAHARQHVDVLTGLVTVTNPRARAFYVRLGFGFSGIERKILKVGGRHFDQEILVMDFTAEAP